jgi:hypothetical protein
VRQRVDLGAEVLARASESTWDAEMWRAPASRPGRRGVARANELTWDAEMLACASESTWCAEVWRAPTS